MDQAGKKPQRKDNRRQEDKGGGGGEGEWAEVAYVKQGTSWIWEEKQGIDRERQKEEILNCICISQWFSVASGGVWCVSSCIQHWLHFQTSRHSGQIAACQQDAPLLGATSSSVFVQTQIIWSPPTSYTAVSSVSLSVLCLCSIQHPQNINISILSMYWHKHVSSQEISAIVDSLKRLNNS